MWLMLGCFLSQTFRSIQFFCVTKHIINEKKFICRNNITILFQIHISISEICRFGNSHFDIFIYYVYGRSTRILENFFYDYVFNSKNHVKSFFLQFLWSPFKECLDRKLDYPVIWPQEIEMMECLWFYGSKRS